MFEDYKVVFCSKCTHSVFPVETAPWGTCCFDSTEKTTICKHYPRSCNHFDRKGFNDGKDKQRSDHEAVQGY